MVIGEVQNLGDVGVGVAVVAVRDDGHPGEVLKQKNIGKHGLTMECLFDHFMVEVVVSSIQVQCHSAFLMC